MKISEFIEKERRRLGPDEYNQKIFSELMMGPEIDRQGYVSKLVRFEFIPSLMMSLVFEILSDGQIQPKDLVTVKQLEAHFHKRNIKLPEYPTLERFKE